MKSEAVMQQTWFGFLTAIFQREYTCKLVSHLRNYDQLLTRGNCSSSVGECATESSLFTIPPDIASSYCGVATSIR